MRQGALRIASTLVAALAFPALAEVYKCADTGGPVYQDAPCAPGRELRNFATDPPPVSVVPMRPPPGSTTRLTAPPPVREKRATTSERKAAKAAFGDPNERRHVRPGMHEGEVMARLGPPDMKSGGNRRQSRWTYLPVPADPQTLTTVVFDAGKVIEVERKVVR